VGFIIGMVLFGIPSALIARAKGFLALRWIFALGVIGLITVSCLPSAEASGITDEEKVLRADRGDKIGAWMCGIAVAINALLVLVLLMH